jgi:hypothetical protein
VFACKSAEVIFVLISARRIFLVVVVGILTADIGVPSTAGADKYAYHFL